MSEHTTLRVLAIAGSLRRESLNRSLLRAARELAPAGMQIEIYDQLDAIPFYNGDHDPDDAGRPEAVRHLRGAIAAADGLLLASPEYNGSFTAVLKNALDWASRSPSVLDDKPVALMGAGGIGGTVRAQIALRQTLISCNALVMNRPDALIRQASDKFAADGTLTDAPSRELVSRQLVAFAGWIRRLAR
jgi:chromate reductase